MSIELDHLVINTRFETDDAAHLFEALGFQLTPRGYHHALGSINHLMVFKKAYLELIGLPVGGEKLRQELLDSSIGINGLVFSSHDAEATREDIVRSGFDTQPVQHFSRPLEIDGREHEARFSAVRLALDSFAAGRVYFCQHHTPELVWRPEWMDHPNGVIGITQLTVVSDTPAATKARFDRLGHVSDDFELTVTDATALAARFGDLARLGVDRPERFAAITLRSRDPQYLVQRAAVLDLPHSSAPGRAVVAIPALSTVLEFIA